MKMRVGKAGAPSRGGFTLVELLVVIAIIGMISAIAVPTIFGAVASARNAKTKAEVDMLHTALMNYKNEYGSFPPANMSGLWNFGTGALNRGHAAYKHIVKIFPRIAEDESVDGPYRQLATLSPAQALVFWLSGFHQNPEYPITNLNSPGSRQKFFDFDESRLYAASIYFSMSGTRVVQTFAARGTPAAAGASMSAYPVYFTGHSSAGLPYVYFDSRCYSTSPSSSSGNADNPNPDCDYLATNTSLATSLARPYINSLPPSNGTWGQQHMNADTFQIIAPGKDGLYGPELNSVSFTRNDGLTGPSACLQAAFPRASNAAYNCSFRLSMTPSIVSIFDRPYADDKQYAAGHVDNITNFADRPLADAIEALKAQK